MKQGSRAQLRYNEHHCKWSAPDMGEFLWFLSPAQRIRLDRLGTILQPVNLRANRKARSWLTAGHGPA